MASEVHLEGSKAVNHFGNTAASVRYNRQRTTFARVKGFFWHLAQMVLAMEAGMGVYHVLLGTVLAQTGYATLTKEYPLFGYWMMVVAMTIPMVALMRYYHRSTWRYCLEMTGAMLIPAVALTVLVQTGLLPTKTIVGCGISDPLMILAMAGYMLVRRNGHAHGEHGSSGRQHAGSRHVETAEHAAHAVHETN